MTNENNNSSSIPFVDPDLIHLQKLALQGNNNVLLTLKQIQGAESVVSSLFLELKRTLSQAATDEEMLRERLNKLEQEIVKLKSREEERLHRLTIGEIAFCLECRIITRLLGNDAFSKLGIRNL